MISKVILIFYLFFCSTYSFCQDTILPRHSWEDINYQFGISPGIEAGKYLFGDLSFFIRKNRIKSSNFKLCHKLSGGSLISFIKDPVIAPFVEYQFSFNHIVFNSRLQYYLPQQEICFKPSVGLTYNKFDLLAGYCHLLKSGNYNAINQFSLSFRYHIVFRTIMKVY